jgi:hypothetical protein
MSRQEESLTIYKSKLESNSLSKQPSIIVTLILIFVAISFYGLGSNKSNKSSKIVTNIIEIVNVQI